VLETVLIYVGVLIPSVVLHEIAHGASALAFGDDTAKRAGRLTLNPLPHVDIFGTLILPVLLAVGGFGVFGYAKPVPVSPARMRRPRDHGLLVALSGPAVNIALAVGAALVLRALLANPASGIHGGDVLFNVLVATGVVNVVLAAFNLLPIPPLDGSAMVERVLPERWLGPYLAVRRYSMVALLILVLLFAPALRRVFQLALEVWSLLL
jgi:Zn-dependent protease